MQGDGKEVLAIHVFGFFFFLKGVDVSLSLSVLCCEALLLKLLATRYSSAKLAELREAMLYFMIWNKMCSFPVF